MTFMSWHSHENEHHSLGDEGSIEIDLEKIADIPIAMFFGSKDSLCVPHDSEQTYKKTHKQVFHK